MIRVEPSGVSFVVDESETIMAAAIRNGYTWPTICGGQGACKTCVFLILDGEENLTDIEPYEQEGLQSIAGTLPNAGEGWRLACQARVRSEATGDVKLRKGGVRPA